MSSQGAGNGLLEIYEKYMLEVDTKQSDFRAQNYRTVSDTLKNDMESKYVDYLLLDYLGRQ